MRKTYAVFVYDSDGEVVDIKHFTKIKEARKYVDSILNTAPNTWEQVNDLDWKGFDGNSKIFIDIFE